MAQASIPRPPFDPAYQTSGGLPMLTADLNVYRFRKISKSMGITGESICKGNSHVRHTEYNISVESGEGEEVGTTQLSLFEHKESTRKNRAVLYFAHGGGQVVGDRFTGVENLIRFFPDDKEIVVASIEYRLAPEHPAPAAAYDCYAGLVYLADHAAELGIDPSKVIIYGSSGGGGIAAAAVLLARKQKKNLVCAQMLNIPMLDDRNHWTSVKQFPSNTIWDAAYNEHAWNLILGSDRENVDEIRCPGRATNLGGLPPAFIDVGSCEVFRDSVVAYASQIWKDGGSAELHVWPGVHHGAMSMEPLVPISQAQQAAQKRFITRTLQNITEAQSKIPAL